MTRTPYCIASGIDVHKTFYQVSIVSDKNTSPLRHRFKRIFEDVNNLRNLLLSHHVETVACESTSDYWLPLFHVLSPHMDFVLGNPFDMKANFHKKTDETDADHIAYLALHKMIKPSRIFSEEDRALRSIIRLRYDFVRWRTQIKNYIHHLFDSELFRLSSVLSDIFGKSGQMIISSIIDGTPIDEVIPKLSHHVKKKEEALREVLKQTLSPITCHLLSSSMMILREYDNHIAHLTSLARDMVLSRKAREYEILCSIPGIGDVSAMTILAEIGDVHDFDTGDKFASWLGIVPRVYQSANKLHTGSITKRGSHVARWILTEAAQSCGLAKDNALRRFYQKKKAEIGGKKAVMATARKIATIIWHLLINDEVYEDEVYKCIKQKRKVHLVIPREVSVNELMEVLREANVMLKERRIEDNWEGFS